MSDFGDGRSEQADEAGGEIESLTTAFQGPVPSPLDDLPPASYWPDGAVPQRRSKGEESLAGHAPSTESSVESPAWSSSAPDTVNPSQSSLMQEPPAVSVPSARPPSSQAVPPYQSPPPKFEWDAEERGNRTLWVLLGTVALLAVGLGGCGYLLFRSVAQPPIDRANDLMADVVDADFAAAAEHVSRQSECFGTDPVGGLEGLFVPNPAESYDFTFVSVENPVDGQTMAFVEGTISLRAGGESLPEGGFRPARVILVEDDDDWQVCGILID